MDHNYTKVPLKGQDDPDPPENVPNKKGKLCFFSSSKTTFHFDELFYEKVFYCYMVINLDFRLHNLANNQIWINSDTYYPDAQENGPTTTYFVIKLTISIRSNIKILRCAFFSSFL